MEDNKKTSIFNQACFLPPSLTDLQPVKIQLNNSVRSAFPTPFGTHTHTYTVQAHMHTNTPMMGSQLYDIWIVIAACGECVFLLTADLYLRLHFVFHSIFCFLPMFFSSLSPSVAALATSGYKHINCIPSCLIFQSWDQIDLNLGNIIHIYALSQHL